MGCKQPCQVLEELGCESSCHTLRQLSWFVFASHFVSDRSGTWRRCLCISYTWKKTTLSHGALDTQGVGVGGYVQCGWELWLRVQSRPVWIDGTSWWFTVQLQWHQQFICAKKDFVHKFVSLLLLLFWPPSPSPVGGPHFCFLLHIHCVLLLISQAASTYGPYYILGFCVSSTLYAYI